MSCVENLTTTEKYDGDDVLVIEIILPNDCYFIESVTYSLPPGESTGNLCNYSSSDYIIAVNVDLTPECNPTKNNVVVSAPTQYQKVTEGGEYAQIIVFDLDRSQTKTRKRTSSRLSLG